jgi:MFS family permease
MAVEPRSRWVQLVLGIICMVMIANLQYGWTLFVLPIEQAHQWGRAAIQVAFTIFVVTETWLVPLEGWVIDRIGPRPTVLIGAAWVWNGYADSLTASTPPRPSAASAPASSMAPPSATRSNGFPTGAAWRPA